MLAQFDPFTEVERLFRAPSARVPSTGLDAYRSGDEFVIEVDLPGVEASSIDVTVESRVLEISAQRTPGYRDDDQVLVAERPHGTVTRRLSLGDGLDTDAIRADYTDGVLRLAIPVAEPHKPRKITVASGNGHQETIEATAS